MIKSKNLKKFKNIEHGFFNRLGGKSNGIYKSLNCGIGSSDKKKDVLKNISIVCKKIGVSKNKLVLLNQVHSNKFLFINKKYKLNKKKFKGDALISNTKKIAIGVLSADCVPILIYDKKLNIISAIHAGWKGVYRDIIDKVINFFLQKGSKTEDLYIAIGPCVAQENYEVKKDFQNKFLKKDKKNKKFFKLLKTKIYFNLMSYVYEQFHKKGVKNLEKINKDTFKKKNNFFSSRRANNDNENDYGRNISIIMLK
mgnify:FL=1